MVYLSRTYAKISTDDNLHVSYPSCVNVLNDEKIDAALSRTTIILIMTRGVKMCCVWNYAHTRRLWKIALPELTTKLAYSFSSMCVLCESTLMHTLKIVHHSGVYAMKYVRMYSAKVL